MTDFLVALGGGKSGSVFCGPNPTLPDCVPVDASLFPATRHSHDQVITVDDFDLIGKDLSTLVVGDTITIGEVLPKYASLLSTAFSVYGAPGLTFSVGWEKGFAATPSGVSHHFMAAGVCTQNTTAFGASVEALADPHLYLQFYGGVGGANLATKADRLRLTVTAVPSVKSKIRDLKIAWRMNYITHANCHRGFDPCPCTDC
jgi:hypothetical protein